MKEYSLTYILLIFYLYCFVGWIWESTYESIKFRKLTNRGFMRGPFLPIYGSAAMTLIASTIPVRNSPVLIFIVSLVSATLLELLTGLAMEAIFKVRYWDYSKCFLNYKGHICLKASLMWGFVGLITVMYANKLVEKMIFSIPKRPASLIAFVITIIASMDFGASLRDALDVRELMLRMSESGSRQIKRLEKRVDVMAAVYGDEISRGIDYVKQGTMEKASELKNSGQDYLVKTKDRLMGLTFRQRRTLDRFISANPEAESNHYGISETLKRLKNFRNTKGSLSIKESDYDDTLEE